MGEMPGMRWKLYLFRAVYPVWMKRLTGRGMSDGLEGPRDAGGSWTGHIAESEVE